MIPKIIHFIWFDANGEPIPEQYLFTLKSAVKNTFCDVWLHTNNPTYVIPGVEVKNIEFPTSINGVPFDKDEIIKTPSNSLKYGKVHTGSRISHMKDIVRLEVLDKYGGIYSDMDVMWLRSPYEFFDKEFVMGFENKSYKILCNAIIMSRAQHPALTVYKNWIESIYPPKKYWLPANPYNIFKERTDIILAERSSFFPVKAYYLKDMKWADLEKSVCIHLTGSVNDLNEIPIVREMKGLLNDR